MTDKIYGIIKAANNDMILGHKARTNPVAPTVTPFMAGCLVPLGGTIKNGDPLTTLETEITEESGDALTCSQPTLGRTTLLFTGTDSRGSLLDFYEIDASKVTGTPGTNPSYGVVADGFDYNEMYSTVVVPIKLFTKTMTKAQVSLALSSYIASQFPANRRPTTQGQIDFDNSLSLDGIHAYVVRYAPSTP